MRVIPPARLGVRVMRTLIDLVKALTELIKALTAFINSRKN